MLILLDKFSNKIRTLWRPWTLKNDITASTFYTDSHEHRTDRIFFVFNLKVTFSKNTWMYFRELEVICDWWCHYDSVILTNQISVDSLPEETILYHVQWACTMCVCGLWFSVHMYWYTVLKIKICLSHVLEKEMPAIEPEIRYKRSPETHRPEMFWRLPLALKCYWELVKVDCEDIWESHTQSVRRPEMFPQQGSTGMLSFPCWRGLVWGNGLVKHVAEVHCIYVYSNLRSSRHIFFDWKVLHSQSELPVYPESSEGNDKTITIHILQQNILEKNIGGKQTRHAHKYTLKKESEILDNTPCYSDGEIFWIVFRINDDLES